MLRFLCNYATHMNEILQRNTPYICVLHKIAYVTFKLLTHIVEYAERLYWCNEMKEIAKV